VVYTSSRIDVVLGQLDDLVRETARHAEATEIEERVGDGAHEVARGDGGGVGLAGVAGRFADHLAHLEAAAVEQERREAAPVVAPAVLVDLRRAAHLAAGDQEDLAAQPAALDVLDERRHRAVERRAHVAQALGDRRVVLVGVEIPHEVRRHGDESAARSQSFRARQHLAAERADVVQVVLPVLPLRADVVLRDELARVVALDQRGRLGGEIEGLGDPGEQEAERLLAERIGRARRGLSVEGALEIVEPPEQLLPVAQAGPSGSPASCPSAAGRPARFERRVGGAETAGVQEVAEILVGPPARRDGRSGGRARCSWGRPSSDGLRPRPARRSTPDWRRRCRGRPAA
jgi:hypothetical protein